MSLFKTCILLLKLYQNVLLYDTCLKNTAMIFLLSLTLLYYGNISLVYYYFPLYGVFDIWLQNFVLTQPKM